MQKQKIELPPYLVDGFVDGLEKAFPEGSANHNEIESAKHKATQFLRDAGKKIRSIEEVRKANLEDPTQSDEAKAVNTWKYAETKFNEIAKQSENLPDLNATIQALEDEMDSAVSNKAKTDFAKEARQRLSNMDEKDRSKFISHAMRNEEFEITAYILGAPAFLSGISQSQHEKLKKWYRNQLFGYEVNALKALESLNVHLNKGLTASNKIMRGLRGHASRNGAIDKSEKAKKLMGV